MSLPSTRRRFLSLTAAASAIGVAGTNGVQAKGPTGTAAETTRFATFNVIDLTTEQVQSPGDGQAEAAARVIQEVGPDVLVINELANNRQEARFRDVPTEQSNARAFAENYLADPQGSDLEGIEFEYDFSPLTNTGVHSGFDLDNADGIDSSPGDRPYGNDAFGYGEYPGQYAFAILSHDPIDERAIRTMRTFRWADMPDSLILRDESTERYLSDVETRAFRLSSKSHADVPISVGDRTVHALLAHPTPPVFDGPANFNGRRCHDEVRLLADYAGGAEYVYDDSGSYGGLANDASYVLMGDMNSNPGDEGSLRAADEFVLDNDDFTGEALPTSPGGEAAGTDTATIEDGLTLDYVRPSPDLTIEETGVVWPDPEDESDLANAVATASDHRLVWADLAVGDG